VIPARPGAPSNRRTSARRRDGHRCSASPTTPRSMRARSCGTGRRERAARCAYRSRSWVGPSA
jgi:hypothetical protein